MIKVAILLFIFGATMFSGGVVFDRTFLSKYFNRHPSRATSRLYHLDNILAR